MMTEDVDSEVKKTVGSIKGLIKIFEGFSDQKKVNIPKPEVKLHKPGSQKITETFNQIDKHKRDSDQDDVVSQLDRRVSVRSLVCNFQKLSTDTEINNTTAKRAVPQAKTYELQKPKEEPHEVRPSSVNSLFDIKPSIPTPIGEAIQQTKSESESTEISSEEEASPTGGYCLRDTEESTPKSPEETSDFDLDDDGDILDQIPLGNGITPLPISYKVISSKTGRLDLKLPEPPKKACLKTHKKPQQNSVVFKEDCEVAETYNMMEYIRADPDLDIVAATAEYEFEKMLERMEKIPVSMKRSPNEKLGLQVYGVSVRTSNEHNNMAIYVKSVTPGSLCERSGAIQVDDLIIEINGESLIGVGVTKVHEVIQKSTDTITLLLGREPKSLDNNT